MNLKKAPIVWAGLIAALTVLGCLLAYHQFTQNHAVNATPLQGFALIAAGTFEMGDHHGFVDPKHGGDETPIHSVRVDAFYMGVHEVTTGQFYEFLTAALAHKTIEVRQGGVYLTGADDLLFETRAMSPYSRIDWVGERFSVLDGKEDHPITSIRWPGAALYTNWLSEQQGLPAVYDTTTWDCDFNQSGFRLPNEAEWEYAARGGLHSPYRNFPWGDDPDARKANWPESDNPFRAGALPWTTPVGFFDGQLHNKADFSWPGTEEVYQAGDGINGYGLYDMAGNVWEFVNDWYDREYYTYSPTENPPGPERGSRMPDERPYRGMRGGNWYNGENGHSRVSNRNPSYWRGPQDPDHPYYHIGFRVVLPINAEERPVVRPTPVSEMARGENAPGRPVSGDSHKPPQPGTSRGDQTGSFKLRSFAVADGGMLPREFTGDGAGDTLPLEWSGAPEETESFVVIMHHVAPDMTKWYWILHDIPASIQSLPKNVRDIGILGNNSVNEQAQYAPPHSKGPGPKTYIYTVYALSKSPTLELPPEQVDRNVMLAAMEGHILAQTELHVVYARPEGAEGRRGDRGPGQPEPTPRAGGRKEPVAHDFATLSDGKLGLVTTSAQVSPGYTLFAPKHRNMTYLLDTEGRKVHEWTSSQYEPGQTVYLLKNGHLLRCCFTHAQGFTQGGEGGRIEEYDWDDNLVWEFDFANDEHMLHHDIAILPNGNILALAVERKTQKQCVKAGFDPGLLLDGELYPDYVVEIKPTRPKGGKIVWEWHVWDHLVQKNDSGKANYGRVADHPERIDVNCNGRPIPAFWNHMNSIAYNAEFDQIMLSVRGSNEVWIIDHKLTTKEAANHAGGRYRKGGGLLYRWGNPSAYGRGDDSDRQLFDQHDAHWIPAGHPGAGNLLVFNNGMGRGYSSVEEIVLPVDPKGNYKSAENRTYGPSRPVWSYTWPDRTDFYSSEISGARRLPNGNTLICAGVLGTFFEVTPAGRIVWKYVNPVVRGGTLAQGEQPGVDDRGHYLNAVFNVHRYPPDFAGLSGRDLTSAGPIELPSSMKGHTGLDGVNTKPEQGSQAHQSDVTPELQSVLRSLGYL